MVSENTNFILWTDHHSQKVQDQHTDRMSHQSLTRTSHSSAVEGQALIGCSLHCMKKWTLEMESPLEFQEARIMILEASVRCTQVLSQSITMIIHSLHKTAVVVGCPCHHNQGYHTR
jgi:hypothetical protein